MNAMDLLGGRRALILAPHPDDESLGCGGLIAAACAAGLAPEVVILTDGAASHPGSRTHPPLRLARLREAEARAALAILGLPACHAHFLRQPDNALAVDGAIIDRLVEIGAGCGVVIGPWAGDPHCDHTAAAMIAQAVAIRTGMALLSYPVWGRLRKDGALRELPALRLDISPQLAVKTRAIAAHESQYGGVIKDSPEAFCLPAELLAVFAQPYEIYLPA